jgi:hypothetical protein
MGSDQDARQVEQLAQDSQERSLAADLAGIVQCLVECQHDLFDLGGELAIPGSQVIGPVGLPRPSNRCPRRCGVSWRRGATFTLQAGAGALLGGSIEDLEGHHPFDPGLVLQVSGTWLLLAPREGRPFATATLGLSYLHASTQGASASPSVGFTAADAFVSASAGWPVTGWLAPYIAGKLFGGPVWWERSTGKVTGTDAYHYQVAVGAAAALPGKFDLLAEWSPVGARAVTVSVGRSF